MPKTRFTFHPLTPDRWDDLVALFGPRGACGGCWCMTWRLSRADFSRNKGDKNKRALKKIVMAGDPPGILAYDGATPVGWCALAPRTDYPALERSRVLKPVDGEPVWSVSCFFIAMGYRRQGLSVALLEAVIKFAKKRGAKILEGYPSAPYAENVPAPFIWTGTEAAFRRAGFREAARRSKTRPIMRYAIR
jgi:GNAT superfamily N-acetyltransferase